MNRSSVALAPGVIHRLCSSVSQLQPGKRLGWELHIAPPPAGFTIVNKMQVTGGAGATHRVDESGVIHRLRRTRPPRLRKNAWIMIYE